MNTRIVINVANAVPTKHPVRITEVLPEFWSAQYREYTGIGKSANEAMNMLRRVLNNVITVDRENY